MLRVGGRRSRAAGIVVVAAVAAACSSSNNTATARPSSPTAASAATSAVPADATAALLAAAAQVSTARAVSLRLHIGAGIADLAALGKVTADGSTGPSSAFDERVGEEVLGGDVTISVASENGTPLGRTGPNGHVDISVVAKGASGAEAELRAIGSTKALYLRADVPKFLRVAQAPATALAPARAFVRAHPAFGFLNDALAGGWLKVDLAPLSALAAQAGASSEQLKEAAFSKVVAAVMRDVTVRRTSSTGGEDHLTMTASLSRVVRDVVAIYAAVPQLAAPTKDLDLTKVPNRNVVVDAVVRDGKPTQLALDVFQFFPPKDRTALAGHHFQILLDVDEQPVTIAPPAHSTPVDVSALIRTALAGGLG